MPEIVIKFDTADGPTACVDAISAALTEVLPLTLRSADDTALLTTTASTERLGRQVDALRVGCAGELAERSRASLGSESLAARKGCGSAAELVTRVTRISASSARSRIKLGEQTRSQLSLSGVEFAPRFPRIAAALEEGTLGFNSAQAILAGLVPIIDNAAIDEIGAAETELVAAATGASPDSSVPCPADEIRAQAQVWKSVLDPDGLEPSEERMMQKRGFSLPRERGGLVYGTYALMTSVASSSACSTLASRQSRHRRSFETRNSPTRNLRRTLAPPTNCVTTWWRRWSTRLPAVVRRPRSEGRRQPF